MTEEQEENRSERVSIITESGISEQRAHEICNMFPELYGIRAKSCGRGAYYNAGGGG